MMHLETLSYLLAIGTVAVSAQTTTLNVTDLLNWPPCAQNCIPLGFEPPADCGSLSNLDCVCRGAAFSEQIASCEVLTCSLDERTRIRELSEQLCAPVGGYAATIQPALLSYLATAAPYPTSTPLGDPANILSYPECAQICFNQTAAAEDGPTCDPMDIECACDVEYRIYPASCEKVTCSGTDYNRTQQLADELCAPVYSSSTQLGPSVTSAIASITSFAAAAVATRDPVNLDRWPACGQACVSEYLPQSGCGTLSNRTCVCQTSNLTELNTPCLQTTCSREDYRVVTFLALVLCNPVGGVGNGSNASILASAPTPTAFLGGAQAMSPDPWMSLALGTVVALFAILLCV